MKAIELFFEHKIGINNFFPRKKEIDSNKLIISGSPFSGKTSLIMNHLQVNRFKNILYIDMNDTRSEDIDVFKILEFSKEKQVEIVVLENIEKLQHIELLASLDRCILSCMQHIEIEGFDHLVLYPPDFEEFLMLYKKSSDVKNSFNPFFKHGSIPHLINLNDLEFTIREQELLALLAFRGINIPLLKQIASLISHTSSTYRFYTQIKRYQKISKDTIYKDMDFMLQNNIVYEIKEYKALKPQSRFFLFDHALRDGLLASRDFIGVFANMLFCEMIKKGEKTINFTKNIDFLLSDKRIGIVSAPFINKDGGIKKIESILKEIQEIDIIYFVTLGNEFDFIYKEVRCEGIPFWEWAIRE